MFVTFIGLQQHFPNFVGNSVWAGRFAGFESFEHFVQFRGRKNACRNGLTDGKKGRPLLWRGLLRWGVPLMVGVVLSLRLCRLRCTYDIASGVPQSMCARLEGLFVALDKVPFSGL